MSLKSTNNKENKTILKEQFRKESLTKLEFVSEYKHLKNSKTALLKLKNVLKKIKFKTICLYFPLKSEVDIRILLNYLRKEKKVYVPFMECVSFKLVKYRLPVQKKRFNIMEPSNSFARVPKIDVAVIPVVGVDGDMRRVGFGKGMYDRFFASLKPAPLVIFIQLTKCFTKERLCEAYDVQADIYITPTDIMIKRGKNVFRARDRGSCGYNHRNCGICSGKKT
ncbi:MAG: 5-formyltetrahydrofolate cyclo-ligase [Campylobacteraceae bacterium]|jgi:5-formyltetrahydrofolate cyclo-ligase|nr:5-formyltetrahydrofolate cyclo-ligase [Campylobacteraceae bacterium]